MTNKITKSIIVKTNPSSAYNVWSNFENFPLFMKNIKKVTKTGDKTSHWTVSGPLGMDVEWVSETTLTEPEKRIAWNTKDRKNNDLTTSGQVTFNPLPNDETEVVVTMQYDPIGGPAGEVVSKVFAKPAEMLEEDLRNFKKYVEGTRI